MSSVPGVPGIFERVCACVRVCVCVCVRARARARGVMCVSLLFSYILTSKASSKKASSLRGKMLGTVDPWCGRVFSRYPRRDMAGYGGIWRDTGRYQEIRDTGRYEIRGDTGRYGERCEEMQGDTGRYGQILERYIKIPQKNRPHSGSVHGGLVVVRDLRGEKEDRERPTPDYLLSLCTNVLKR